jgi:hypothetical protein
MAANSLFWYQMNWTLEFSLIVFKLAIWTIYPVYLYIYLFVGYSGIYNNKCILIYRRSFIKVLDVTALLNLLQSITDGSS